MNAKQIGNELASNLSAFFRGLSGYNMDREQKQVLSSLIVAELKNYRRSFSVDNKCNVLDDFGKVVYHAPTQKQAQEIADALSTYVG